MAKEKDIFRQLWIAGFEETMGFQVECGSEAGAISLRLQLYNYAKPYKKSATLDPKMHEIVASCSVLVAPGKDPLLKDTVIIRQRMHTPLMLMLKDQIERKRGGPLPSAKSDLEESLDQMAKRIQESLEEVPDMEGQGEVYVSQGKKTPYY